MFPVSERIDGFDDEPKRRASEEGREREIDP